MTTIQNLVGTDTLKVMYPKVNANFTGLKADVDSLLSQIDSVTGESITKTELLRTSGVVSSVKEYNASNVVVRETVFTRDASGIVLYYTEAFGGVTTKYTINRDGSGVVSNITKEVL